MITSFATAVRKIRKHWLGVGAPGLGVAFYLLISVAGCSEYDAAHTGDLSGKGGSLARFATTLTHLYAVNDNELNVYRFEADGSITAVNQVALNPGVETITTRDNWLYIGTNQAMLIYDITTPSSPLYVSEYQHLIGCDPVVVRDTLAFVTLRTSGCRPVGANTLDILNIKDPELPVLIASYGLQSPYGLGVDGNLLFVCEGENGLKVLDVSDPHAPVMLKNYQDVDAYDVITNRGILVLTGRNGIVQYDYSDHLNIRQLSIIQVQ